MYRFKKHYDLEENKSKCIPVFNVIELMKASDEEKILKALTKRQYIT